MAWDKAVQKPWLKKSSPAWVRSQQRWQPRHQVGRKRPPSVPDGYHVQKELRFQGKVLSYYKWKGYGFLRPDEEGVVPENRLYVHWSNIQTDDRFPSLMKDMEVEFGVMRWKERGVTTLRAKFVTQVGGENIAIQDSLDAQHKTFVGGQDCRFSGMLKFYSPKGGYGYVVMDDGYELDESVPKELRVEEAEVNAAGKKPKRWLENLEVEFGIWQTTKGAYKCYNMSLPGGVAITDESLENRQVVGTKVFTGKICYWNWRKGFGLIKPDAPNSFPASIRAKLAQTQKAAQQQGKKTNPEQVLYFRKSDTRNGFYPKQGETCSFMVYSDDKGAGACEVR